MVGGDTFSPIAPDVSPEQKNWLRTSASCTDHGGQYDTEHWYTCDIRVGIACGINGDKILEAISLKQLVTTTGYYSTKLSTTTYFEVVSYR